MSAARTAMLRALDDCIKVMERELNGLAVIQPELEQARAALALGLTESVLSPLREAAHAGYKAACRDVYALVEETGKSSNIVDDFTRGRCFEAKGIARTLNALGTESDELRKALGEVMRATVAKGGAA